MLGTKELGAVMRSLGNNPSDEEIEEMIDNAAEDRNRSGNFPECIALMRLKAHEGETREEINQAFQVFDENRNGYVSTSK